MTSIWEKILASFLLLCFMFSTTAVYAYTAEKPFTLEQLYAKTFTTLMIEDPETAALIGIADNPILELYSGELTDVSVQHQQKKITAIEQDLGILKTFNTADMTNKDKLSYDIYKWYFQNEVDGKKFMYYDYPINPYDGVQQKLPDFLTTIHVISDQKSAEKYVERLSKVDAKFDGLLESLKLREEKGLLPPKFVLEKALKEMRIFISPSPKENILVTSFARKLELITLSEKVKAELLDKASVQMETGVYPAYKKMIEYVESLMKKTTNDAGVWKHPDGDAYYFYKLRGYTTTNLTPEQIHQIGLAEVSRIEKAMKEIIHILGYANSDPGEFMKDISKDNRFKYPDTQEGRLAVIKDYKQAIAENSRIVETCLGPKPLGTVEVKPVPEFNQASSPLAYLIPTSSDGLRPSTLYINLGKIDDILKYNTKSLAAHETIPGHHIQRGIQRQLKDVPMFRKAVPFPAFAEGWAMYAEQLLWEQSTEKNPYDNLGRLQTELWRAARLVADTGIHYKRWTREEAINYMIRTTGMPENAVAIEIDRYIIDPGQACAYKIGMLKILELREKAKQELGTHFNLREFHNAVLANGAMPLELLETQVNQYIINIKAIYMN